TSIYGTDDLTKATALPTERTWASVRSMKELLTDKELSSLLREGTPVDKPLAALSPKLRERFLADWRASTRNMHALRPGPDGRTIQGPLPEPDTIFFKRIQVQATPAVVAFISGLQP